MDAVLRSVLQDVGEGLAPQLLIDQDGGDAIPGTGVERETGMGKGKNPPFHMDLERLAPVVRDHALDLHRRLSLSRSSIRARTYGAGELREMKFPRRILDFAGPFIPADS